MHLISRSHCPCPFDGLAKALAYPHRMAFSPVLLAVLDMFERVNLIHGPRRWPKGQATATGIVRPFDLKFILGSNDQSGFVIIMPTGTLRQCLAAVVQKVRLLAYDKALVVCADFCRFRVVHHY